MLIADEMCVGCFVCVVQPSSNGYLLCSASEHLLHALAVDTALGYLQDKAIASDLGDTSALNNVCLVKNDLNSLVNIDEQWRISHAASAKGMQIAHLSCILFIVPGIHVSIPFIVLADLMTLTVLDADCDFLTTAA